jgi:putative hydrolase
VGPKTAAIATQAVTTGEPTYLAELEALQKPAHRLSGAARALLDAESGACHTHSDWSDGGSPPLEMALACVELGHEWTVLTDHSPRLTVARGSHGSGWNANSTSSPRSTANWRRSAT